MNMGNRQAWTYAIYRCGGRRWLERWRGMSQKAAAVVHIKSALQASTLASRGAPLR